MDVPDRSLLRPLLMAPDEAPAHVLVVAADPLARAGLAALLAGEPALAIAGSAAPDDLAEALGTFEPDLVLWDAGLDATLTPAFDLTDDEVPLVALLADAAQAADAWAAGARTLLAREAAPDVLVAALGAARQRLVVLDATLAGAVLALRETALPAVALTAREHDVLGLLAEGLPNKLIADRLAISENTVKFHVASILGKLDAHSRTEAVMQAARLGLLIL